MLQTPSRAAIYARISSDRDATQVGVDRQAAQCRERIEQEGWLLAGEYIDNNRSAMKGRRPRFQELLADLDGIDVIVCWSADRLYRQTKELEHLVDVLGDTKIAALHSGDVDLSTADGRAIARVLGAFGQRESEKTSERVTDAVRSRVLAGKRHGGPRAFGWEADGTPRDEELNALVWAVKHLDAGGTLGECVREWTSRGLTNKAGGPVTGILVRRSVCNPTLVGMRRHRGQAIQGTGEPVVDLEQWQRVTSKFVSTGRGRPESTLLSGLLICGRCGGKVLGHVRWRKKTGGVEKAYRCFDHHCTSRKRDNLDAAVTEAALDALEHNADRIIASIRPAAVVDPLAPLKAELQALTKMFADGQLSAAVFGPAAEAVQQRIQAAEALPRGSAGAAAQNLVAAGDIRGAWEKSSLGVRRQVLGVIIKNIVLEARRGGGVEIIWR